MRFAALCLLLLATLGNASAKPPPAERTAAAAHAAPSGPPHAWLFGTWTGGLFPVLDGMVAQDCRTQPTVTFSRDLVNHTSLLSTAMSSREVATVRATPNGAEFRFAPATDPAASFGCENPDELHVARSGVDQINFPHCSAFPYSLERCPAP
jgi:hypothetical protein